MLIVYISLVLKELCFRSAWNHFIETYRDHRQQKGDIHNRLMSKYRTIPQWWFYTVIIFSVVITIPCLVIFKQQLQLSIWGLLYAIFTCVISTFCGAVFLATANQVLATSKTRYNTHLQQLLCSIVLILLLSLLILLLKQLSYYLWILNKLE